MPKPKLLLVTYYWPPAADVGVYRWLYFTKYLAQQGFEITVIHPENAGYQRVDEQLQQHVHETISEVAVPIIEPNQFLKQNDAQAGNDNFEQKQSLLQRAKLYIRANIFIPDARMLWIKPATKKAIELHKKNTYDVVITNGPPHSCHLIGRNLKQKFSTIKWIADFRDPWQEIDYFEGLLLTKYAKQKHTQLEKEVLQTADCTTTVSPSWRDLFLKKGAKQAKVFTNGFVKELFKEDVHLNNSTFTIRHIGSLDADRNATNLWKVAANQDLKIELIGKVATSIQKEVEKYDNISVLPPIPHEQAIESMQTSDALLLCNSKKGAVEGRIPAKLFEYIGAKRPILYVGSTKNDANQIIKKYNLGICLEYNSSEKEIEKALESLKNFKLKEQDMQQFERKSIAREFKNIII